MALTTRLQLAWKMLTRSTPLPFQDYVNYFNFDHNLYTFLTGLPQTMAGGREEEIDGSYGSLVQYAYKSNGVIFACMTARMLLFAEARFQFQRMEKGRPGELFGTAELKRLEKPSPGQVTGDLLGRMLQDADTAGNSYWARRPANRVKWMRPNWVSIILGSDSDPDIDARDIDAEIVAYVYHPGGKHSGIDPEILLPETVAHFHPIPDPLATFRGMSWITPIVREVMADTAATSHKLKFFENGATPNMIIKRGTDTADQSFGEWVDMMESKYKGLANAYRTLYMTSGADATVVGSDFRQMDFKVTQGAGETRIAAAAGVPPVIVGLSEGLQGSSLNAGNYAMARRRFADLTMRPLWRNAASSLESIVDVPEGARLWYDDRDIPFLQEDVKDAADIMSVNAAAIRTLSDAGAKWDAVIDAVIAGDLARLKGQHSGLYSVQLQPPGSTLPPVTPPTQGPPPKTKKPEAPPNA